MDDQIVFAPECDVDLTAFLSAWNRDPECRAVALAPNPDSAALHPGYIVRRVE